MSFKQLALGEPVRLDNPGHFLYNESKNRYTNVLPSTSIVKLSESSEITSSDYINADRVQIEGLSQQYILTQEPLDSTVADFWKMIWETKSKLIVALVNQSPTYALALHRMATFGSLLVQCTYRKKLENALHWHTYKLTLGKQELIVQLLHSKAWPDFGVPSYPTVQSLLSKIIDLRCNPIVVHCTAGVGRSGMLCLLDAAKQLRVQSEESLLRLLALIRLHRRGAVSTEKQFQFVVDYLKS